MRPIGVDFSKYQAPQDLAKPHGIAFATMVDNVDFLVGRAGFAGSAGGAWVDPRIYEYMVDLKPILYNHPIPFTMYWYFRDDVSIMDQVNRFSAVVNANKGVINLPLVVDAEAFTKTNLVSTQKIIDFQTEVERQTGLKVDTLYGRAGQLNSETTPGLPEVLPNLWVARYDTRLNPQTDEPWVEGGVEEYVEPRDYQTWKYWQYSEKGNEKTYGVTAGAIGIDENVYNGTREELRAEANLDKPVPPPPPEVDYSTYGCARKDLRSSPVGPNSETIEFFHNTDTWFVPKMITVQAPSGVRVTVEYFVDGIGVPLFTRRIGVNKFLAYTLSENLMLAIGDGIMVTLENDSAVGVVGITKLIYEG